METHSSPQPLKTDAPKSNFAAFAAKMGEVFDESQASLGALQDAVAGALERGDPSVLAAQLAKGGDVNGQDEEGYTPLHAVCLHGNAECADLLLNAQAAVDLPDNDGSTPLYVACRNGFGECVEVLLRAHAAVDLPGKDGSTPLYNACEYGYSECVRLLLDAHAAVDLPTKKGIAPLMAASNKGRGTCVRLLLAANAVVDQPHGSGKTALMWASNRGREECVELLLAAHAAVDHANNDGDTALTMACNEGHSKCVQVLLAARATINHQSKNSLTPLLAACGMGRSECAQLLIDAHAAVDLSSHIGITPLFGACQHGHLPCVELLIAAHAALDQQTIEDNTTPLHGASRNGHLDVVKRLVKAGARRDLRGKDGFTALQAAENNGFTAVASYLRMYRRAAVEELPENHTLSADEIAAKEKAAELAAAELLAEEEASEAQKSQKKKKKASKKAKQGGATSSSVLSPDNVEDVSEDVDALAAPSAANEADEALHAAMADAQYDLLAAALEKHCALASEDVLAEARAMRERLHKKRKKESQKLRRAHAVEMEAANTSVAAPAAASGPAGAATQPSQEKEEAEAAAVPVEEVASAGGLPAAVALTLGEITAATGGFGQQKLIGSGGYGRVFRADMMPSLPPEALPPKLRNRPVAVKRAKSGAHDLADLKREVNVLQQCSHPHLLPLLGYYLELESPCLVFPLMRGGSFADRLFPSEADPEHLRRLGLAGGSLQPLGWRERVRILRQATDALVYLHTPVPGGKGAVVHRDFKPENILLDDDLNACLADTGFAKMDDAGQPEASHKKSVSNALYLTTGYLDPIIIEGGAYSAVTDGWALGITLLVALTGRSPLSIINKCEDDFDEDFADIGAEKLADVTAGWPVEVATAIKELVRSGSSKCLCHGQSSRKRLAVTDALATLTELASAGNNKGESSVGALEEGKATRNNGTPAATAPSGYEPTPLSMQVRGMRKGGDDPHKSIKDNMLLAFNNIVPRMDAIYATRAAEAPEGFEERINFWHRECGMATELKGRLHTLRIWANAARHHDADRWRRDGPRNEAEASRLVSAVQTSIDALER